MATLSPHFHPTLYRGSPHYPALPASVWEKPLVNPACNPLLFRARVFWRGPLAVALHMAID